MRLSHGWRRSTAVFDDENLLSCAGLLPVLELAEQAGLSELLDGHVVFVAERVRSGVAEPAPTRPRVVAGVLGGAGVPPGGMGQGAITVSVFGSIPLTVPSPGFDFRWVSLAVRPRLVTYITDASRLG